MRVCVRKRERYSYNDWKENVRYFIPFIVSTLLYLNEYLILHLTTHLMIYLTYIFTIFLSITPSFKLILFFIISDFFHGDEQANKDNEDAKQQEGWKEIIKEIYLTTTVK